MDLSSYPRVPLCHSPTPLEPMENLSRLLGGPNLYVKRDDCTGLATGGNKTRKLEWLMADALGQNADVIVTQGAVQSNHVRQTAAAAAKLGLKCQILLERRVPGTAPDYETTGNVFLDRLYGAEVEFRPGGCDMNVEAEKHCNALRAKGAKAYLIPGGGSNKIGALGYAACVQELLEQANSRGLAIQRIVHATGSAGTQAGIIAGLAALGVEIPVLGISVRQPKDKQEEVVFKLACDTAQHLGTEGAVTRDQVVAFDDYVGPGYGQPTPEMVEAIRLTAIHEGILLDPVYSGKGMAGLIGLIRQGFFDRQENVIFLHTGGAVALFAYEALFRDAA